MVYFVVNVINGFYRGKLVGAWCIFDPITQTYINDTYNSVYWNECKKLYWH